MTEDTAAMQEERSVAGRGGWAGEGVAAEQE